MIFPREFQWGVATAAYQIEGAAREDGRGESIWDRFSHTSGMVANGDTGDVACDHYHRYEDDVALMADLGIETYRFSIAWSRIFPSGEGAPNPKGLDFYKRLVDALLRKGIRPAATLYHWDLPQRLEEKGGWGSRDTALRFAEYAATMFRELGDLVPQWITHNEPWCASFLGHALAFHAPGHDSWPLAVRASHHLLVSHGLAVQAFREIAPKGAQVGITLNLTPIYPATESEADRAAAWRLDGFHNRWFADPVLKGSYPADLREYFSRWAPLDYIRSVDEAIIGTPTDFLGVNYYSRGRFAADPESPYFQASGVPTEAPVTEMGWEIVPDCLYDLLVRLKRDYGEIPIYITENGAAFADVVNEEGAVEDNERVEFLKAHFAAAERAMADGVNLKGYYVWSFMDNFEWTFGYEKRFGIVYVDYATQRRIPKRSALWYRDFIKQQKG